MRHTGSSNAANMRHPTGATPALGASGLSKPDRHRAPGPGAARTGTDRPQSATCQPTRFPTPNEAACHLHPSVPTSRHDVVPSMVSASSVGAYSLHTVEVTGSGPFTPASSRVAEALAVSRAQRPASASTCEGVWKPRGLSRAAIELSGDRVQRRLVGPTQVAVLGQVLAEQAVGVLVGAALPGAARVTEEDLDAGVDREPRVLGHLPALVPG
jgi:hypothetical protein